MLHIQHPSKTLIELETVFGKLHGLGTDPVLKAAPPFGKRLHIKREALGLVCLEEIPENLQALFRIQLLPNGGQLAQMGDDIRSHTCKISSCLINVLLMDTDRQIPFLINAVVGAADLG